jgi:nuclease S1
MIKLVFGVILMSLFSSSLLNASDEWGSTGHRATAAIATFYLNPEVKLKIDELLDGASLALVSTFADEIKSDARFKELSPWHYVNYPFDSTYDEHPKSDKGDIIVAIRKCMEVIQDQNASKEDKVFYLKLLVHFMGDLHQPLHVGKADDRGGNEFKVSWFDESMNLHRVWDEKIIEKFGMSYTELAENKKQLSPSVVKDLQAGTIEDWMKESKILCLDVYDHTLDEENLGYNYMYRYQHIVREQLQKGGIRLAALLNQIFQ